MRPRIALALALALALPLASSGCLLDFDERLVQLEQVCERDGVIRCYGFDDPEDLDMRVGFTPEGDPACRDERCTQIVSDEYVSGTGAIRFETATGSEGAPLFSLNFSDDLTTTVGEGETLYVQWRQRMAPDFIRGFAGLDGNTPVWSQLQIGDGDQPGMDPSDRCSDVDVAVTQDRRYMGPAMFVGCASAIPFEEPTDNGDILLQNGDDAQCPYSDPTVPPCVAYVADRWTAYQVAIEAGTWQQPTTRVRMWMVDPGQGRRVIFDTDEIAVPAAPGERFGKVWVGPSIYNRDSSEQHPPAFTWYDNLVISTEEIPDPEI